MGKKGALFDTNEFNIENEIKKKPEKQVKSTESEPIHNNIPTMVAVDKPVKKKVGRPKVKTEDETLINIAIPISVYEQMNIAKACYGGNLTKYVNAVIIKDLAENYTKYETINNSLNSFNNI